MVLFELLENLQESKKNFECIIFCKDKEGYKGKIRDIPFSYLNQFVTYWSYNFKDMMIIKLVSEEDYNNDMKYLITKQSEKIVEFIKELAWQDVKYDAFQSTIGEFSGSLSAVPRYAKKYFDLWKEMFKEDIEV